MDGAQQCVPFNQTPNTAGKVMSSQTVRANLYVSRGKQPRSTAKVPKLRLSGKGSLVSVTARRLA